MAKYKRPANPVKRPGYFKGIRTWDMLSESLRDRLNHTIKGHKYVELWEGLKWATCNIGASTPEEVGDYFAWGETEPYYSGINPFTWKEGKEKGYLNETNKYFDPGTRKYTKYTNADGKMTLEPMDDAATANWGGTWRMPTREDWERLLDFKSFTWAYTRKVTADGKNVEGYTITSNVPGYEGNELFLVITNQLFKTDYHITNEAFYWSSSWYHRASNTSDDYATSFYFGENSIDRNLWDLERNLGFVIRPVSDK